MLEASVWVTVLVIVTTPSKVRDEVDVTVGEGISVKERPFRLTVRL